MDINALNGNNDIKWKQLTAKEIIKYRDEGNDVPEEYQSWAVAISAALNVKDDVTYEMVNGSTDISAIEEDFGTNLAGRRINEADETEENLENNLNDNNENEDQVQLLETQLDREQSDNSQQEEDVTLADQSLLTDPNEIIKRNLRRGKQSL